MNHWLDTTLQAHKRYFSTPERPLIYEVGSRDGNDGVELASRLLDDQAAADNLFDRADIVLIEPNPPQAEAIRQAWPRATLVQNAVLDYADTLQFVAITGTPGEIGSSSLDIARKETKTGSKDIIEVQTKRLDAIRDELGHTGRTIHIMKIDVEGYTYEALQSLGEGLADIEVLHVETEVEGLARSHTNLQVFDLLRDAGWLCYAREHEWGPGIEDQVWVNATRAMARGL